MKLARAQADLLRALITGSTLKSHRYLDGRKVYKLHPLEGPPEFVERSTVDFLKEHRFIDSNKKFPAATYLLTEKGKNLALSLVKPATLPITARPAGHNSTTPDD